jgi:hypothetical protein
MTSEQWMDFAFDASNEAHSKLKGKTKKEVLDILYNEYKGMYRHLMFMTVFHPILEEGSVKAKEALEMFIDYRNGKLTDEECDVRFELMYYKYKQLKNK